VIHSGNALRPRERLRPSEFARRHMVLDRSVTNAPGPFQPAPFQVEPLDAIVEPSVRTIVMQWASQLLGKSTVMLAQILDGIANNPRPMLYYLPTEEDGHTWSKMRLAPAIDGCAPVKVLIDLDEFNSSTGAGRQSTASKRFPQGSLQILGGNSSSSFRSHTGARVFVDEGDIFGGDINGEGDPVSAGREPSGDISRWKNGDREHADVKGKQPHRA
jgi:phage terminase large subunit GpA-like protein